MEIKDCTFNSAQPIQIGGDSMEIRKVRDMFRIIQLDDGSDGLKQKAEEQLKLKGCTEFSHLSQSDIRNDQCWLQSTGYVLEAP